MPICMNCNHGYDGDAKPCPRCGAQPIVTESKSPLRKYRDARQTSSGSTFTDFCLGFGQLISVLGVLASLLYLPLLLFGLGTSRIGASEFLFGIFSSVVGLLYSCAMLVVFTKVKEL